jgi:hypothetical protein
MTTLHFTLKSILIFTYLLAFPNEDEARKTHAWQPLDDTDKRSYKRRPTTQTIPDRMQAQYELNTDQLSKERRKANIYISDMNGVSVNPARSLHIPSLSFLVQFTYNTRPVFSF